jgi:GNAT superfamily N-acetyltransferase
MGDQLIAMHANLRAFYRLLGERSPGGSLFERAGVLAAIVPSCPHRSIVNAVVYDDTDALIAAQEELRAAYAHAGVRAWTVWVTEGDRVAGEALARRGHRIDASPRAMTLELRRLGFAEANAQGFEQTEDTAAIATLNERAYGLSEGEFSAAMTAFGGGALVFHVAQLDGRPAACVGALDHGADCGIYLVATAPAARGRGLASGLMRRALLDARARGCATSSLQATQAGFPVYRRLGYRDVCAINMWEHR